MKKSVFIISLDLELFWGVRDKRTIAGYGKNIQGVRMAIPALLELFGKYNISATFAAVGFLFARNKRELLAHLPVNKPVYNESKYSPYANTYLDSVGYSESDDIYHYGESLIKMIRQYPEQEIASHTFSHFYCLENASPESFKEDIFAARRIASTHGIDLKTIVFPRNQFTQEHISICQQEGFIGYRGNEKSSLYHPRRNKDQSKYIRAARFTDAYLNLTGHHTFDVGSAPDMINIPASRFLRPFSPKLSWVDGLRLRRIKNSMLYAAKNNECYHLWWHPHNFGIHLQENLSFLEKILKHYNELHLEFGMQSKTMKSIAEEILESHAN